jgi:toxin YoeB
MRNIAFTELAFREYNEWLEQPDMLKKIRALIRDTCDNPFKGLGKPEPLKGNYAGCWSRRITDEHRMIYSVSNDEILLHSLKGHYSK